MNTIRKGKYLAQNPILTVGLILLIIGISACSLTSRFEYQVHVQAKDSGEDLAGAHVRIEVGGEVLPNDITDANGIARIFIDSSKKGQPARLTVEIPDYKKYERAIQLDEGPLPTIVQLESGQFLVNPTLTAETPALSPTFDLTGTPSLPSSTSCPWILYLNGASTSSLSDENCLNDVKVKGIGVSGDAEQISFFVDRSPSGKYGLCRDISDRNNLNFTIMLRNNIASARFLVAIGPDPVPGKSAYAFRIQPESASHEMYVKFIQYTADYPKDINKIQATTDWLHMAYWKFDFIFRFSGTVVTASMNNKLREEWQLNPSSRYLCFAYEAMPTEKQATHIDASISFP